MMAVSGSFNFKQNRDDFIKDALVTAKVIRDDETPTGTMNSSAYRLLNRMIKAYTAFGLQLWVHKDAILFLENGKRLYNLYDSGDRWIIRNDAVETKLNGALDTSDTAVTVVSTSGMSASDIIGIVTASNTMHWDTISSVDSSTTLTLTTGVAASAADEAYVVAYTSKAPKPYRIVDGYIIRYAQEDNRNPIRIESKNEYYSLAGGTTEAAPIIVTFTPELDKSILEVWPTPDADNHRLILRAHFPFDDMDEAQDDFQFPDYWYEALHYNLAYRLSLDYGIKSPEDQYDNDSKKLERMAMMTLQNALDFDVENTYIQIEPEYQWLQGH